MTMQTAQSATRVAMSGEQDTYMAAPAVDAEVVKRRKKEAIVGENEQGDEGQIEREEECQARARTRREQFRLTWELTPWVIITRGTGGVAKNELGLGGWKQILDVLDGLDELDIAHIYPGYEQQRYPV